MSSILTFHANGMMTVLTSGMMHRTQSTSLAPIRTSFTMYHVFFVQNQYTESQCMHVKTVLTPFRASGGERGGKNPSFTGASKISSITPT